MQVCIAPLIGGLKSASSVKPQIWLDRASEPNVHFPSNCSSVHITVELDVVLPPSRQRRMHYTTRV